MYEIQFPSSGQWYILPPVGNIGLCRFLENEASHLSCQVWNWKHTLDFEITSLPSHGGHHNGLTSCYNRNREKLKHINESLTGKKNLVVFSDLQFPSLLLQVVQMFLQWAFLGSIWKAVLELPEAD